MALMWVCARESHSLTALVRILTLLCGEVLRDRFVFQRGGAVMRATGCVSPTVYKIALTISLHERHLKTLMSLSSYVACNSCCDLYSTELMIFLL